MDVEALDEPAFWYNWYRTLMLEHVLRRNDADVESWRAGLAGGVVPLVSYIVDSPIVAEKSLDKLWLRYPTGLLGFEHPAPIEVLVYLSSHPVMFKLDTLRTPEDHSAEDLTPLFERVDMIEALSGLGVYVDSLGQPPWASSRVHRMQSLIAAGLGNRV